MNERALLDQIETDLQKAPIVLYLEGKTDPDILFGLLGVPKPVSGIHGNVYVVGLGKGGSGGSAVKALIEVATKHGHQINALQGVAGVIDGDGQPLKESSSQFDVPHHGPLFVWKAYCIENLLAKTTWPAAWGAAPDWATELAAYAPYVALNRLHLRLRSALDTLRLAKFSNPAYQQPLLSELDVQSALEQDKHLIAGRDVAQDFSQEAATYRQMLATSLDDAHTLLNGKWLANHFARTRTAKNEASCLAEWIEAARSMGGLAEVRDFWERIAGAAP